MTSVWRNKDFMWLFGGQTISEFGAAITMFAVPWLMLELTGSALQMGLSMAAGMLPFLLLSLPAGVWADRYDRKKMMMLADAGRMLCVVSIPVASAFGVLTVWQLYVVQAGMSACQALFDTAYVAGLPNVVGREHLQRANAVLQGGISVSQILGPSLAGVMVGWFGAANAITVNGFTFLISVISLLAIRKPFSVARTDAQKRGNMLGEIGEGLQYVWNHKVIRSIALLTATGNLGSSCANAVLLYHMQHNLHISAQIAGTVFTGFSIGTIIGSLVSGFVTKHVRMGTSMAISSLVMAVSTLLFAVFAWPWAIFMANLVAGIAAIVWNVQSVSLRQSVIPDKLLGRASSAIRMIAWGSMPLGNVTGGALGQAFGAPIAFVTGGLLQVAGWAAGYTTPLYKASGKETFQTETASGR